MSELSARVREAAQGYLAGRIAGRGRSVDLTGSTDLFAEGVLDSVALTELIAAVEKATGREIDFIAVDPDALGTLDGLVDELSRAAS